MRLSVLNAVLFSVLFTGHTYAQDKSILTFEGSSFSLRARNQHKNSGERSHNQLQYNVDLKVQLRLDKDGKWRIIGRTKTGKSFESGWNDLGVGNDKSFADDLALRQLYVQYESDGVAASLGALPVVPDSAAKGIFAYDEDGWVDGGRLSTTTLSSWAKKVTVTFGRIDDLDTPSVLSRGIDSPNVIQVHVQGKISQRVGYMVEATQFDSTELGSEQYLRAVTDIAVDDVVSFIDKIVLESLAQNNESPLQGFAVSAKKALACNWSVAAQYSFKGEELANQEDHYAPRNDQYRVGHQLSLQLTKKFTSIPLEWGIALGKTVSVPNHDVRFLSTEGLRAETRLKIKF